MSDAATRWLHDDELDRPRAPRRVPPLVAAAVLPWLVIAALLWRDPPPPDGTADLDTPSAAAIDVADLPDEGTPPAERTDVPGGGSAPATAVAPPADTTVPDAAAPDAAAPDAAAPETPATGGATASADRQDPDVTADTGVDLPHAGTVPAIPDLPGITRISHGAAESLAIALTRAWLTDAGPDLAGADLPVERRGYLEHATVERIELAATDTAVATVTVVLLERSDDEYVDALLRRVAVPLTLTETTVHPGGTPWWLPGAPDLTPAPPELTPLEDPAATRTVLDALTRAGYRDATVTAVATTAGGTYVADVTATTPAGERVVSPVWLRPTGSGAEVLGYRPDATV